MKIIENSERLIFKFSHKKDIVRYFGKPNTIYKAYQRWFRSDKLMTLFTLLIKPQTLSGSLSMAQPTMSKSRTPSVFRA